jgi:hypothetical protein
MKTNMLLVETTEYDNYDGFDGIKIPIEMVSNREKRCRDSTDINKSVKKHKPSKYMVKTLLENIEFVNWIVDEFDIEVQITKKGIINLKSEGQKMNNLDMSIWINEITNPSIHIFNMFVKEREWKDIKWEILPQEILGSCIIQQLFSEYIK